jgi:hypothetical protein
MEVVREHFIFTSHSGTPLAVWDIRSERLREAFENKSINIYMYMYVYAAVDPGACMAALNELPHEI